MPKNGEYKLGVEKRLTRVESELQGTRDDIKELKENHLYHLQMEVEEVRKSVASNREDIAKFTTGLAVAFALLQIVLKFI